ncbi:MAG: glycosyltransferase family 2 protein [Thermoleophilia bacterium]|nr:glycosyltransferase family 2 protein [Thermoleophilia bacterium]
MPHPEISVVVPVCDERDNVEPLLGEMLPVMRGLGRSFEVIFVDDGSRDGTGAVLEAAVEREPEVALVALRRNFGKSEALMAGFREARGGIVITIDGDLQDDPAEIPRFLDALDGGLDLVSGWKVDRQDPAGKRLPSKLFNAVTRRVSGLDLHDLNCGFKAYRAEVVAALALAGDQYRYIPVLAHNEGFRVGELGVNHRPRTHGRSKYGLERYVRGMLDLLTITFLGRYRHRPMHLFGGLGLLMLLVGLAVSGYLSVLKFAGYAIGQRPLLLLGVLLILVGMQFLTIGLMSEMVQRQHQRTRADEAAARVREVRR